MSLLLLPPSAAERCAWAAAEQPSELPILDHRPFFRCAKLFTVEAPGLRVPPS